MRTHEIQLKVVVGVVYTSAFNKTIIYREVRRFFARKDLFIFCLDLLFLYFYMIYYPRRRILYIIWLHIFISFFKKGYIQLFITIIYNSTYHLHVFNNTKNRYIKSKNIFRPAFISEVNRENLIIISVKVIAQFSV